MSTKPPTLQTGPNYDRAIDRAIDMLGLALRSEYEDSKERQAQVLRGRLSNADRPGALGERVREAAAKSW